MELTLHTNFKDNTMETDNIYNIKVTKQALQDITESIKSGRFKRLVDIVFEERPEDAFDKAKFVIQTNDGETVNLEILLNK